MLDNRQFLIKERIGFMKLVDSYDIYDPATGARIGVARENVSTLIKLARLLISKRLMPTTIEVRVSEASPVLLTIRRGVGLLHYRVAVLDQTGRQIGSFRSKLFSLGGGFDVLDTGQNLVAEIKGDWKGWNFTFLTAGGQELGRVTKKWAGLGKELFTSADNYMIVLHDSISLSQDRAALLLAAGLAIDIVYKEK